MKAYPGYLRRDRVVRLKARAGRFDHIVDIPYLCAAVIGTGWRGWAALLP
jgi:hypothetical protein